MRISQNQWKDGAWDAAPGGPAQDADLVLLFGGTQVLQDSGCLDAVRSAHPGAQLIGCSTAGEICGVDVADDSLVATAIHFEHSRVAVHSVSLSETAGSFETGVRLARAVVEDDLTHVFVLSDGLSVDGSELVNGLASELPEGVQVTGGLSGDGGRFERTFVLANRTAEPDLVGVVGLYGDRLKVSCASLGGWDPFGPERLVTRSQGNVLFDVDGQPALDLYKKYLGKHAEGLPATGLLFPLALRSGVDERPVVRTILSVDEDERSLTFAGSLPEGSYVRLMKANFDRLIDGAAGAASASSSGLGSEMPELAILISCVGRKMVLKQRVEEEVEAVRDIFGESTVLTGFYSYGEISPFAPTARCELHNQTMTITALRED